LAVTDGTSRIARLAVVVLFGLVAFAISWVLFYAVPGGLVDLLGILLVLAVVVLAVRLGSGLARAQFPDYNVAEVAVKGPITRDGGTPGPLSATVGTSADDIVEQIERADESAAEALVVKLNTPGGEIVPSDDIRRAAAEFDGPTVAYATDTCASGGYWIASGCDELWARRASIVGSIGVIGSRPNVSEFAEEKGISYERFVAGKFKDAGTPLKELTDDERAYLQGIIDDFYDDFVERVAEGRGMDEAAVRDTEARVYVGGDALELGLVDDIGARDAVEDHVAELIGAEVTVEEFTPEQGIAARLRGGAERVAYAAGAGVASSVAPEDGFDFRF
jgi:protease-4